MWYSQVIGLQQTVAYSTGNMRYFRDLIYKNSFTVLKARICTQIAAFSLERPYSSMPLVYKHGLM